MVLHTLSQSHIYLTLLKPYAIDCGNCRGLCCIALYFTKGEGFPSDKTQAGLVSIYIRIIDEQFIPLYPSKGWKAICLWLLWRWATDYRSFLKIAGVQLDPCKGIQNHLWCIPNRAANHQILWYLTIAGTIYLEKPEAEQITHLLYEGTELSNQSLEVLQNLNIASF